MNTERDWSQPIKGSDFTPELARDFLIEMCRRGCGYQCSTTHPDIPWVSYQQYEIPRFTITTSYRLPPIPRTEPFTQATVPKGALWRRKGVTVETWLLALSYFSKGLYTMDLSGDAFCTWENLQTHYEYSEDGGKTWNKAERIVE